MKPLMLIKVSILLSSLLSPGSGAPSFSPSDGCGTAVVEPSGKFRVGSAGTWGITFTAGEKGIAEGGGIVLLVSPFWKWSHPQISRPSLPGYVTAKVTKGRATLDLLDAGYYAILVRIKSGRLQKGDTVVIMYGDTSGGKNPGAAARIDRYSERETAFHIKVDGDGDGYFKEIAHSPTIDVVAGPPAKLLVIARSTVAMGEKGDVALSVLDVYNNRVESYTGSLTLSSDPPGLQLPPNCRIESGGGGATWITFKAQSCGIFKVEAVDKETGLKAISNPIEVVPRPGKLRLYWADLHGHSNFSDGTGLPEDYYKYGKDVTRLDALALTDHDAWGVRPLDENPEMWKEIKRVTNSFYKPGSFVTFIGYEWTNWNYGHIHVLFKGPEGRLISSRPEKSDTPPELWSLLPEGQAITIPHHPGGGPVHIDWNYYNPEFEPLVEICSVHGISERYGGPLSIYHAIEGAFVQDALKRSYRLGFVGGGDSHTGHPGIPYVDAPVFGMSGVYASELTREGIWEALRSRRTYATTGDRIILRFDINGSPMGEEIERSVPLRITAETVPCAPVKSFELVRNNRVIHRVKSARLEHSYAGKISSGDYFYVRLTQENGHSAMSSPIWIK